MIVGMAFTAVGFKVRAKRAGRVQGVHKGTPARVEDSQMYKHSKHAGVITTVLGRKCSYESKPGRSLVIFALGLFASCSTWQAYISVKLRA